MAYFHLVNRVPNNFITRWIVDRINKKMKQSKSIYKLQRKYRCPKVGTYSRWGDVKMDNSRYFSVYLRSRYRS